MSIADKLTTIAENEQKVYEAGYNKGKSEGGGSLLSDNLVIPPGESLVPPYGECLYTINADGTVTIDAQNRDFIWMHSYDMYDEVTGFPTVFSFLPIKNGNKKYKLTVIVDEDVEGTVIVRYSNSSYGQVDVCTFDIKDRSGAATFTTPEEEAYLWLEYIYLPCLPDKTVTYTFDLREVLDEEAIYEDGFEAGKKAEYDTFWDSVQNNGERTNYDRWFGYPFNDVTFKPKYDMNVTSANYMFNYCSVTNLKAILESQGVKLDFSKCSGLTYTFQHSQITHLGEIDTRSCANLQYTFNNTKSLKWVDKLILKNDGSQTFSSSLSFAQSENLEHIIFEGVVGVNGLNMQKSTKLDKESLTSIINALSSTATGLTVTLSKVAVNNAFGIDVDDETTWTEEWNTLRNSKSNWTFSFA